MRRKRPKRRFVSSTVRKEKLDVQSSNECWSMDFVADQLVDGRRIRVLTIVDNFTRESLGLYVNKVKLDFSRPGKPTDNAFIESFNGKFRAECLNENRLLSLTDARDKIEQWRDDYNHHRPHTGCVAITVQGSYSLYYLSKITKFARQQVTSTLFANFHQNIG